MAKEGKLARKPANLTYAQAAVVPISGGTALQAVHDVARPEPGQSVLVLGASGGVGTYAVQLAKALGAEVTGVCSTAKVDLVSSLGADHVLDYDHQDFADKEPAVRPHPRHRRQPVPEPVAASPEAPGDCGVRGR